MARTTSLQTHHVEMFSDTVLELLGSPQRSLLKALVGYDNQGGEACFLDGIGASAAATNEAWADATNERDEYEQLESPALADWVALQTPHMEVTKQRTLCLPRHIEWGHTFSKANEIAEMTSPQSRTLKRGAQSIFTQEDTQIIEALSAATVSRGKNSAGLSSVSMPATQQVTIANYAAITTALFTTVVALFEDQYAEGEKIFLLMNPTHKKQLIDNSGSTIHSSDFVSKANYFENGTLPDIYGVNCVTHPLIGDTEMYAFTEYGVTWNQFSEQTNNLGEDPGQRFRPVAHIEEYGNAVRVDDLRVVQITLTNGS